VLQVVQVIISAVLLIDLMSKRQDSSEPKLQQSSVSA
jgi:hypothetical protein